MLESSIEETGYGLSSPLCDGGVNCYGTEGNRGKNRRSQSDVSEYGYSSSERNHECTALVDQCWEYERITDAVSVKGRLAMSVKFWEEVLQAPDYIVNVIKSGYVMPFTSLHVPTKFCKLNQNSALVNVEFVEQAINEWLADGRVREVDQQPWVCSPLSVVESSTGKKRLVLNLWHVNNCLQKQRFKYEDLRIATCVYCYLKGSTICSCLTSNRVIIIGYVLRATD